MFSEKTSQALQLSNDEGMRTRITKSIADCYTNQGELAKGLELYEVMLKNDPQNETLKHRVESLRTQLKISTADQKYKW